ncbi:unnamed protein product [Sphenostylis stenocarpa]|uniref:Uncharacterized protein n=1 Tax=Sphenostylis stenocarpa TaxID=92480 RepID=A0AA86SLI8_9FABA|nr:unnamed protein product [Sphenostylis stenocarpa]
MYAELLFLYLDVVDRDDNNPLTVPKVLRVFEWKMKDGKDARALGRILARRRATRQLRARGAGEDCNISDDPIQLRAAIEPRRIVAGLSFVYRVFDTIWTWSQNNPRTPAWDNMLEFSRELLLESCAPSMVHIPMAEENRKQFVKMLQNSRAQGLL